MSRENKIVKIEKIDKNGYEWLKEELGIDFETGK